MNLKPDMKAKLQAMAVNSGKTVDEIAKLSDEELVSWYLSTSVKDGQPGTTDETLNNNGGGTGAPVQSAAQLSRGGGKKKPGEAGDGKGKGKEENTDDDSGDEIDKLKDQVTALSRFQPKSSDDAMFDRIKTANDRIDLMVEKGSFTPARAEKLKKMVKRKDGKPNALLLSRFDDADEPLINSILDIVAEAKTVEMGDKTGAQDGNGDESAFVASSRRDDAAKGGAKKAADDGAATAKSYQERQLRARGLQPAKA